MYRLLIPLLLLGIACTSLAQTEKPTIAVLPFKDASGFEANTFELQNAVESAFVQSNRFGVVERSQLDALIKEMELQSIVSERQLAELGRTAGAAYVVLGNGQGPGALLIRMVEVATGRVKAEEVIHGTHPHHLTHATLAFINRYFPFEVPLLAIVRMDGLGVQEVDIASGSNNGLLPGEILHAYEKENYQVNGHTLSSAVKVAKLRVLQVTGPETSRCVVHEGHAALKRRMEEHATLVVMP